MYVKRISKVNPSGPESVESEDAFTKIPSVAVKVTYRTLHAGNATFYTMLCSTNKVQQYIEAVSHPASARRPFRRPFYRCCALLAACLVMPAFGKCLRCRLSLLLLVENDDGWLPVAVPVLAKGPHSGMPGWPRCSYTCQKQRIAVIQ
jgi:hypothetical protein